MASAKFRRSYHTCNAMRVATAFVAFVPFAGAFSSLAGYGRTRAAFVRPAGSFASSVATRPARSTAVSMSTAPSEPPPVPPAADFNNYWDKIPPVYESSTRVSGSSANAKANANTNTAHVKPATCHHHPSTPSPFRPHLL